MQIQYDLYQMMLVPMKMLFFSVGVLTGVSRGIDVRFDAVSAISVI